MAADRDTTAVCYDPTQHIDTAVAGDPGSCDAAAQWLSQLGTHAELAGEHFRNATQVAESGWEGPAAAAFQGAVGFVRDDIDHLVSTATRMSEGLAEFGSVLSAERGRMEGVRDWAVGGGLTAGGASILRPEQEGIVKVNMALKASAMDRQQPLSAEDRAALPDEEELILAVAEHNARVRLFNDCIDRVRESRVREEEAHRALREAIVPAARDLPTIMLRLKALSVAFAAGKEGYKVLTGDQTWEEAGFSFAGLLGGAWAGSRIGSVGGPWGSGAGAAIGSLVGGLAGEKIADFVLPQREDADAISYEPEIPPEWVSHHGW